jgi:hypothetical protein
LTLVFGLFGNCHFKKTKALKKEDFKAKTSNQFCFNVKFSLKNVKFDKQKLTYIPSTPIKVSLPLQGFKIKNQLYQTKIL